MKALNKIKLVDYQKPLYEIPNIFIEISILEKEVNLVTTYYIEFRDSTNDVIYLKGVSIKIDSIRINELDISKDQYIYNNDTLKIWGIKKRSFKLIIKSSINPYNNTSLEGLYQSNKILTTQCEAEGFRRICFHPDRPDVLSIYNVTIEADHNKYPVLLSNGNLISSYKITNETNRHRVIWNDPIPKPSYLFALVAGKLDKVCSEFTTCSGKQITINIFVEEGDVKYTNHALLSLKKAMRWDEEVYGFEYDLELYNIVAIRHFNMGAMENKSLNIFNSKLILADSEIATDFDLERVESVIAHEYFHNWTGNRITCRDWFQLSLKEGLTVFRDQSFTSDLHSYSSKRIEDVSFLRSNQFKEDAGPTSHAVKPNEYNSIDNFYTTTIYEKGAEIIRMLLIMLGKENFMAGIKEYAKVFDGKAATTEDLINSLINGAKKNGYKLDFNIKNFMNWYYLPGTPYVSIKRKWYSKKGKLILIINQNLGNIKNFKPLVIPIKIAFLNNRCIQEKLIILQKESESYTFKDLNKTKEIPILSYFRQFSSPVNWETDLTIDEMFYIAKNETDNFSRWNIFQSMYKDAIVSRVSKNTNKLLEELLIDSLRHIISNFKNESYDFIASIITLPPIKEVELSQDIIDPIEIFNSYYALKSFISNELSSELELILEICKKNLFAEWPLGKEKRKLTAAIWDLLIYSQSNDIKDDLFNIVKSNSMTLSLSALNSLSQIECKQRENAMTLFYERWKNNSIVLDTWFGIQASIYSYNSIQIVKDLLNNSRFDSMSPNSIRSVLGGFIKNTKAFHSKNGKGYLFIAEQIINIDKKNPITASKLIKNFSNWEKYVEPNSKNMFNAIHLLTESNLSENSNEIIDLIIKSKNIERD